MQINKTMVIELAVKTTGLGGFPEDFAMSCLKRFDAGRRLSEKQELWFGRLYSEHVLGEGRPEPKKDVANLGGLYARFDGAAERLRYPKVTVEIDGTTVEFYRAGERSKVPGAINITDGQPYGQNRWYGRIERDGTWTQPRNGVPAEVEAIVRRMEEDPEGLAADHGHAHGNCCFCRRAIETDESLAVGYGPVCADNYGLPWGAKS